MDNLKGLCSGQFLLVPDESVQPLESRLDILLSKQFIENFLCVTLSHVIYNITAYANSLDFPCLTSLVANARVESTSTSILTSISVIATV